MTSVNSQSNSDKQQGNRVDVTITYLEQTVRPVLPTPARPRVTTALMRAKSPPIHFYRYLYRLVGDQYNWVSRRRLDDDALAAIIHDPAVYIYVFYVEGVPAGFAEIDGRDTSTHYIKFFGLAPDYIGRNLGRYFFTNVADLAWSLGPERVCLETCSLDHPAALPLYQKLGFRVFDRRQGIVELMETPETPH